MSYSLLARATFKIPSGDVEFMPTEFHKTYILREYKKWARAGKEKVQLPQAGAERENAKTKTAADKTTTTTARATASTKGTAAQENQAPTLKTTTSTKAASAKTKTKTRTTCAGRYDSHTGGGLHPIQINTVRLTPLHRTASSPAKRGTKRRAEDADENDKNALNPWPTAPKRIRADDDDGDDIILYMKPPPALKRPRAERAPADSDDSASRASKRAKVATAPQVPAQRPLAGILKAPRTASASKKAVRWCATVVGEGVYAPAHPWLTEASAARAGVTRYVTDDGDVQLMRSTSRSTRSERDDADFEIRFPQPGFKDRRLLFERLREMQGDMVRMAAVAESWTQDRVVPVACA